MGQQQSGDYTDISAPPFQQKSDNNNQTNRPSRSKLNQAEKQKPNEMPANLARRQTVGPPPNEARRNRPPENNDNSPLRGHPKPPNGLPHNGTARPPARRIPNATTATTPSSNATPASPPANPAPTQANRPALGRGRVPPAGHGRRVNPAGRGQQARPKPPPAASPSPPVPKPPTDNNSPVGPNPPGAGAMPPKRQLQRPRVGGEQEVRIHPAEPTEPRLFREPENAQQMRRRSAPPAIATELQLVDLENGEPSGEEPQRVKRLSAHVGYGQSETTEVTNHVQACRDPPNAITAQPKTGESRPSLDDSIQTKLALLHRKQGELRVRKAEKVSPFLIPDDGMFPTPSSFKEALHMYFRGPVQPLDAFLTTLKTALIARGFTSKNTRLCVCTCRDELARPFVHKISTLWNTSTAVSGSPTGCFDFSTLGGVVTFGKTGIAEAIMQAPLLQGKRKLVFIVAPHLAISERGGIGRCLRDRRKDLRYQGAEDPLAMACSSMALIAAELDRTGRLAVEFDGDDIEECILRQKIAARLSANIATVDKSAAPTVPSSKTLLRVTKAAYEATCSDIKKLVKAAINTKTTDYCLITGILLHGPPPKTSRAAAPTPAMWIQPGEQRVVMGGLVERLQL